MDTCVSYIITVTMPIYTTDLPALYMPSPLCLFIQPY